MGAPRDTSQLDAAAVPDGVEFALKVVPGASRSRIAGLLGAALKVAVAAPPEGGKANAEVVALLAEKLGVRKADVRVASGRGQPHKRIQITGLDVARLRAKLAELI